MTEGRYEGNRPVSFVLAVDAHKNMGAVVQTEYVLYNKVPS